MFLLQEDEKNLTFLKIYCDFFRPLNEINDGSREVLLKNHKTFSRNEM